MQVSLSIVRFHPSNLSEISQPPSPAFTNTPHSLIYRNRAYYVAFDNNILVLRSDNITLLHTISTSVLSGSRHMMFLNDGQTMIVASTYNGRLVFFNRSSVESYNYDCIGYQNVSCLNPQGLFYVNDTFFYATSWTDATAYTYSNAGNVTSWTETLFLNATSISGPKVGNHISIDGYGRYWFSLGSYGVKIFHDHKSLLGTLQPNGSDIFDTLFVDSCVLFLSDTKSNRIIRMDPNIQC